MTVEAVCMIVADGSAARSIAWIAFSTLRKRNLPVSAMGRRILTRLRIAAMTRAAAPGWARALRLLAAVAALLLPTLSCSRGEKPGRVIVLGLDGADPETIDLLMSEGKLPNFGKLRREGAYGPLASQKPLLSPV